MLCLFKKESHRVRDSSIFAKSYNEVPAAQKRKFSIKDFFSIYDC